MKKNDTLSLKSVACIECRKQHRKCMRDCNSDICKRCSHMGLTCALPSADTVVDPNEPVDGMKQLRRMRATVDLLEHTIQQVELEINQCRGVHQQWSLTPTASGIPLHHSPQLLLSDKCMSSTAWLDDILSESSSSTDSISDRRSMNKETDNDSTATQSTTDQRDGAFSLSTTSPAQSNDDQYLKEQQQGLLLTTGKEWKMTLVNGQWRIETDIKTLRGLDQLNQIISRSPSPFPGFYVDTPITIEPCNMRTLLPVTVKLARNHLLYPPKVAWLDSSTLFPTPPILTFKPKWVIDRLVYMYFKCYNPSMPILHEPTYMEYYRQLKDPLTCPVTMALCTYICCGHHHATSSTTTNEANQTNVHGTEHDGNINSNNYDNDEDGVYDDNGYKWFSDMVDRRGMGEYFYRHCRNILDDIFDDPQRRLETVTSINLLKRFLMNTLRLSEMRKLETIAYLICLDLKPIYQSPTQSSKVERAMFARHYAFCIWCHVTVDFFMDSISQHEDLDFIYLEVLPGESDYTRNFVDLQNHLFEILLHPSVYIVFANVQKILLGTKVEMTLETILQFEHVAKKWWQNLPDHLRLCDDPYDFDTVMKCIRQTHDDSMLTLLLSFVDTIASFHYCLLKVQTKIGDGDGTMEIDSDVLSHIREKSVKACLDFSEMLMVIVNQLDTNVGYSQFLSDAFIFVAVDILASLALSSDKTTSYKAKQKIAMCFSALDAADFMAGHRVPVDSSPLTSSLINSNANLFHLYSQYPQPRYALLYDICRYLSPLDSSLDKA
ncbi:hypothetical protein BCR42DRAFT_45501 [Absidia repens]|uniref:Zn(2)-C6 fungal-type domain-containing protein n=1 Tax=Absidia repens TaxID=90262 RepID=A0A1X2IGE0_9FUNG|nr:hypothetical protein BCR42DRAFT_45501 [Absidia repens]